MGLEYYRLVIIPTSFCQNPLLILLIAIKNTAPNINAFGIGMETEALPATTES